MIEAKKIHPVDIPAPVAANHRQGAEPPSRLFNARWKRILFRLGLTGACVFYARQTLEAGIRSELEGHEGRWIEAAFTGNSPSWHSSKPMLYGQKAEELFFQVPNTAHAIEASRQYALKPHLAGSPQDFETAKYFLKLLQDELGIPVPEEAPIFPAGSTESRSATLGIGKLTGPQAWIDVYYPFMNTPLDHSLEILDEDGKSVWKAELEEVADDTDPEAGKYYDAVTTWHGLSFGGEAKGKLVYANYGRKEDFDELVAKGVNLNGTIVLTRYGGLFRGLKVKGAQEHGAVACLIYSDPRDDGAVTEENGYAPYPWGPARNPNSVQRGSTQFLSFYPGDPTTPGYPSYENSTRTNGTNIPSIPSLPLSWANAQVLLEEIAKGGKNRTISLVNHVNDRVIPIWNTMGVIPGVIKDEVVVVGNHRDAWVMGATDPTSGTASVHEVVRGLGELLRHGWKPLRTIVIASWDAEEYGLIGSTEWGEDFEEWIGKHVVAYFNLDSSVSGSRFSVSASPLLAHFVRSTAEEIPHPNKPWNTLWDATKDKGVFTSGHIDAEVLALYEETNKHAETDIGVGVLGSGSDYTVFVQRSGIASANGGFGSTLQDPVYHYHSVFDSQRWQEAFGDPGFVRHTAVALHLGLQTIRLADSIVLPFNTTHNSLALDSFLDKVEDIASATSLDVDLSGLRASIKSLRQASAKLDKEKFRAEKQLRRIIRSVAQRRFLRRKFRTAACRMKSLVGKECKCPHAKNAAATVGLPHHGIPGAVNPASGLPVRPRIGRAPAFAQEQREKAERNGFPYKRLRRAVQRIQAVNKKLISFERGFIHEDGIKDREWYRHLGVAPGKWLGYGATTFPALTEAFTIEKNATLAKHEVKRLQGLIDKLAKKIEP